MAAPRRRTVQRWWRAPVLGRVPRRRVQLVLALSAVAALATGVGAGVAVDMIVGESAAEPAVAGTPTELGPVTITLPSELGPWVPASDSAAAELRETWTGPVELDGVWGELTPSSVMVTVLTAAAGTHGGVDQFGESVPQDPVTWSGDTAHAAGSRVADGVRELVLVTETGAGDLVILSVSGPEESFASGELTEAFRTATVE